MPFRRSDLEDAQRLGGFEASSHLGVGQRLRNPLGRSTGLRAKPFIAVEGEQRGGHPREQGRVAERPR
jgi:hypothetical protein